MTPDPSDLLRRAEFGLSCSDAAEALRRERYARRVRAEFAALRADPQGWQAYLSEADLTAVADGVDYSRNVLIATGS